jgi:hypothetical protein
MDSKVSSTYPASIDLTLAPGASDALSQATTGNSSRRHATGATLDARAGARNRPEIAPARAREQGEPPRTGLSRLPSEIIGRIADNLPPKDVIDFANTNRSLRYALAQDKRGAMLILRARARPVRTPAEARQLLSEIQNDVSRPHLRATALAELITTMDPPGFSWPLLDEQQTFIPRWPPDSEHTVLYNSVWTAIMRLPLQYQAEPLESFAPTLCELPDVRQPADRFDAFLHQTTQLPPQLRAIPLAAFTRKIVYLQAAERQATYNAIFEQVPQLPAQHRGPILAALAPYAPHLPEPAAKFDALLKATRHLPAPQQCPMLEELALTMGHLPQPLAKFHALLEAARQLPAPDQGPTLSRLVPFILNLPTSELPAAFAHAMEIINEFAPEQRAMPLAAFAQLIP